MCASVLSIAGCGSSTGTVVSPTTVSKCAVSIEAPASTLSASGGTGSITVSTARECQWTAQSEVPWLSIPSGASGQGEGAVQFSAVPNPDPVVRTGGIDVNGRRAQLTQAAADCVITLAESSASYPQAGGSGSVGVRASSALCSWAASSETDWITITSGASGKGSSTVAFTVAPTTGPPRAGTLKIAGQTFSVTQSEGCAFAITPSSYGAGAAGGTTTIAITTASGCPWTAASNAPWIAVSPATGTGSGSATITVAATDGPTRTGTATIAGQIFTVTQSPGCSFSVSPLSHNLPAGGGTAAVSIASSSGCAWTATSNAPWLTITSGASGNGAGSVSFSAAATTGPSRSGTLTIAGQTVTVSQGEGCTFAISPDNQSVPAAGGTGTVSVTAGGGCAWTASSNASWISITQGASGSGNGNVAFRANATTGPSRAGTITIAGRTFTVNQGQGCSFSLASSSASAPAGGGNGSFDVRTADGCGWSASSNASWLSVTGGATGSGNGTVRYSAAANTGPSRSGTITAAGQTFTVTQSAGCSYSIAPDTYSAGAGGATTSVAVTVAAGCAWTASSNASWIGISSGASGTGNGTVQLVVAANSEADRQGTVTIAGRTFTVTQASGCTIGIAPSSSTAPAAGATGSFAVTGGAGCAWTASPSASWISITSGANGSGNGTVQFAVAANSGPGRTGTIAVAGQTFTIVQDAGCDATVSPDTIVVPSAGSAPAVNVAIADACAWTAAANAPWLRVQSGGSGTGNGAVQFQVDPNTGPARSGTATVAGRTVTFNQDSGCSVSISPATSPMVVGGGAGTVTVTAGDGCPWTAVSNVPWITVTAGASGTGSGSVGYAVEANASGAPRSGTITIGGQTFTVEQAGS